MTNQGANGEGNSVSVIDTATHTVVATITVDTGPGAAAVTPNGAFVYVANFSTHTVSVIDTATNSMGTFAYVSNSALFGGTSSVSVISTATNTVVATIPVGLDPQRLAFVPNSHFACVANQLSNTVSVINTATNTVVATIPVGVGPVGVAITPPLN